MSRFLLAFSMLCLCACGGSENEGDDLRWECYADSGLGTCECYGLEPGATLDIDGSNIEEVASCSGYETCMSYFDTFFEENRCDCGDATFMPSGDLSDIEMQESCPTD